LGLTFFRDLLKDFDGLVIEKEKPSSGSRTMKNERDPKTISVYLNQNPDPKKFLLNQKNSDGSPDITDISDHIQRSLARALEKSKNGITDAKITESCRTSYSDQEKEEEPKNDVNIEPKLLKKVEKSAERPIPPKNPNRSAQSSTASSITEIAEQSKMTTLAPCQSTETAESRETISEKPVPPKRPNSLKPVICNSKISGQMEPVLVSNRSAENVTYEGGSDKPVPPKRPNLLKPSSSITEISIQTNAALGSFHSIESVCNFSCQSTETAESRETISEKPVPPKRPNSLKPVICNSKISGQMEPVLVSNRSAENVTYEGGSDKPVPPKRPNLLKPSSSDTEISIQTNAALGSFHSIESVCNVSKNPGLKLTISIPNMAVHPYPSSSTSNSLPQSGQRRSAAPISSLSPSRSDDSKSSFPSSRSDERPSPLHKIVLEQKLLRINEKNTKVSNIKER
jgi:hypothetical protein